ncbi:MAG: hypothetical protein ACXIVO_07490 [Glycocaulis sp.]
MSALTAFISNATVRAEARAGRAVPALQITITTTIITTTGGTGGGADMV